MDKDIKESKLHMKKADAVVIVVCLMAALLLAAGLLHRQEKGHQLCISYDGETIMTVEMEDIISGKDVSADGGESGCYYLISYEDAEAVLEKCDGRPDLLSGVSYNLLYVSTEGVQMESADCRDQICVHHRPLTGGGESIICLPHRLVVELVGGEVERTDGMVK